jgi:hypothetical protein
MARPNPGRSARVLKLIGVNLLVTVVLLEVASAGVFFLKTGEVVYVRNRDRIASALAQLDARPLQAATNNLALIFRLHPYFGFVYRQGYVQDGVTTNNFGFLTSHDFPFRKTRSDQFVVGVFGGSVAALFSLHEPKHRVLAEALRRLPSLADKEIVILSFAGGSYKQPQQLLILNYFLSMGQKLDLVVNIDGFNEAAFSYLDNRSAVDVSMPSASLISPLIDLADKDFSPQELTVTLDVLHRKSQLGPALKALGDCTLGVCYSLRWLRVQYLLRQYAGAMTALSTVKARQPTPDSVFSMKRVAQPLADDEATERIADEWATSSVLMSQLLTARNIPYVHVIQPNQYFPTSRRFSDEEKRIAFTDQSTVKAGVINGYPKLLARVERLRAAGVNVLNGVRVFDQVPDIVYVDNCCHYNDIGSTVFGRYVAQGVVSVLSQRRGAGLNDDAPVRGRPAGTSRVR